MAEESGRMSAPDGLWGKLNQPVVVTILGGLLVFLITSYVQELYWRSQQRFLSLKQRIEVAESVVESLARSVGKVRAASASIVGGYEQHYGKAQLNEAIEQYNTAEKDWDENEGALNLKIQIYFPENKDLDGASQQLSSSLDVLDDTVANLLRHSTVDTGGTSDEGAKKCRDAIAKVDASLERVESLMVKEAGALGR